MGNYLDRSDRSPLLHFYGKHTPPPNYINVHRIADLDKKELSKSMSRLCETSDNWQVDVADYFHQELKKDDNSFLTVETQADDGSPRLMGFAIFKMTSENYSKFMFYDYSVELKIICGRNCGELLMRALFYFYKSSCQGGFDELYSIKTLPRSPHMKEWFVQKWGFDPDYTDDHDYIYKSGGRELLHDTIATVRQAETVLKNKIQADDDQKSKKDEDADSHSSPGHVVKHRDKKKKTRRKQSKR